ncbi:MAG: hypothetical protein QGG73_03350 [Candidatus Hydrogenedentes bacterium]|nr:hypothetical protein [Candidatus Hydrogenedentota bacterium]
MEVWGYRLAIVVLAAGLAGCAAFDKRGPSNPAVGTWATTVTSPMGAFPMTLTLNVDMTGTVSSSGDLRESLAVSNAVVDGQTLTYGIVFDIEGQELPAVFNGTIDGDSLNGEYETAMGNATVTGTRE